MRTGPHTCSAATTRRSRGSTGRRAPSRGPRRRCCARRGSAARYACWTSGAASATWPSSSPSSSIPAARCSASTSRRGTSRSPRAGARRPASRTSSSSKGTRGLHHDRAVRRDRRAPVLFHLPDREEVLRASATHCAPAARWSWSSSTSACCARSRRSRSSTRCALDRGGVQVGGCGPAHRRAGRATAAPCGVRGRLDIRDPGLLRPDDPIGPRLCAGVTRSLAPQIVAQGIADEAELGSRPARRG